MTTVETMVGLLRRRHLLPAAELRQALDVSAPTLMRLVRSADAQVLAIGRARRTAYAARRSLRGSLAPLPLYRLDAQGNAEPVARLHLAHPHGTWVELTGPAGLEWPMSQLGTRMRDGWFEGLPYFLQDMRPQGFLGRQFARAHAALLQVSENPADWSDDDALHGLSLLGADPSGNFILGDAAFRAWQAQLAQERPLAEGGEERSYPELARQAMGPGHLGSSAAGEFPKFGAVRRAARRVVRVLVKFSGSDDSPGTRRWSDLLVCEHLASQAVSRLDGLLGSKSRILHAADRTFLEVERFDRHGLSGRSGVCSWSALNADWYGLAGRSWMEGADAMRRDGLLDEAACRAVARLVHFGRLIANTDMHDGNLSFQSEGDGRLRVAPVYDMLPMAYRPQVGVELGEVEFAPRPPLPGQREDWSLAAKAAQGLWESAAADPRISRAFRAICRRNAARVAEARGA